MTHLLLQDCLYSYIALSGTDAPAMLNISVFSMNLMPLVSGLLSFLFAALIVGTGGFGLYLLFAPADSLVVMYQNYHLRRSMKPLKDEDFGSYASIVRRMRSFGIISLMVAIGLAIFMIHSFETAA